MDSDDRRPSDTANHEGQTHCFRLTRVVPVVLGATVGVLIGAIAISHIPYFIPGKRGWSTVAAAGAVLIALGVAGAVTGRIGWSRSRLLVACLVMAIVAAIVARVSAADQFWLGCDHYVGNG